MGKSSIPWLRPPPEMGFGAGRVWNVITRCNHKSDGCINCWAQREHDKKYWAWKTGSVGDVPAQYHEPFLLRRGEKATIMPERLLDPARTKAPAFWFVNSVGDLFHPTVPVTLIQQIFAVMRRPACQKHYFIFLTKYTERMVKLAKELELPPNCSPGVSIENQKFAHRADDLRHFAWATGARSPLVISFEPLIGPVTPNLDKIGWIFIGGESGDNGQRRPLKLDWVRDLVTQAHDADIKVHFKQVVSSNGDRNQSPELDGAIIQEFPAIRRCDDCGGMIPPGHECPWYVQQKLFA